MFQNLGLPGWHKGHLKAIWKCTFCRMEDTYPANNLFVMAKKTDKKSISDFGNPEAFLKEMAFLFGERFAAQSCSMKKYYLRTLRYMHCNAGDNTWQGQTRSEGGFGPNKVSAASILDAEQVTGKDGKPHYNAHVLIRSADGNEGGRHQIISAAVSNGQLYILKAQIGDKRWYVIHVPPACSQCSCVQV